MAYKLKNGKEITCDELKVFELDRKSEAEIAKNYGISRQRLYHIREKMECPKGTRSDKGKRRVSLDDQRERRNAYMRKYYHRNSSVRDRGEKALGRELKVTEAVVETNSGAAVCDKEYARDLLEREKMRDAEEKIKELDRDDEDYNCTWVTKEEI